MLSLIKLWHGVHTTSVLNSFLVCISDVSSGVEDDSPYTEQICKYSRTSINCFSRGWRKQTNARKRLIRETITHCKKNNTS